MRGDSGDCVKVVTETVFHLWDIFGGTVNSKGYKVLDPHVKALYGDSITIERAEKIYSILEENGFAAQNVSLGVGSFSMHCIEEDNENGGTDLLPFTRDTFGVAIKACYAEFTKEDGTVEKLSVYKDPKTDRENGGGHFKKSQKGCCVVYKKTKTDPNDYWYGDEYDWDQAVSDSRQELKTVFKDGKLVEEVTLAEVRERLNNGKF